MFVHKTLIQLRMTHRKATHPLSPLLFHINLISMYNSSIIFSSHLCSPTFVSIAGFECSYDSFRLSLQPRGFVSNDLMAVFVQYFNDDHKLNTENIYDRNKVAFTPFLVVLLFYLFFYLKFSARTNLSFLMSSYTEFCSHFFGAGKTHA